MVQKYVGKLEVSLSDPLYYIGSLCFLFFQIWWESCFLRWGRTQLLCWLMKILRNPQCSTFWALSTVNRLLIIWTAPFLVSSCIFLFLFPHLTYKLISFNLVFTLSRARKPTKLHTDGKALATGDGCETILDWGEWQSNHIILVITHIFISHVVETMSIVPVLKRYFMFLW